MTRVRSTLLAAVLAALALPVAAGQGDTAAAAPATSGAWIGEVRKLHNVDVGGGTLAVQLTAPVETWGMKGRTVAVVIFFHDALGNPIASNGSAYADESGHLRLVSDDAVVNKDREGMDFQFRLPYVAFPRRAGGRYEVEGRVRLIERTAAGRSLLATGSVRFFVE